MEFPRPTIDTDDALRRMIPDEVLGLHMERQAALGLDRFAAAACLRSLFAQAWEEGRWSPPGATLNPYGEPAVRPPVTGAEGFPGLRLLALRAAAQAALTWLENMAPTVRRTALAEQLRSALGGK